MTASVELIAAEVFAEGATMVEILSIRSMTPGEPRICLILASAINTDTVAAWRACEVDPDQGAWQSTALEASTEESGPGDDDVGVPPRVLAVSILRLNYRSVDFRNIMRWNVTSDIRSRR